MAKSVYASLMLKDYMRKKGEVVALRKELKDLWKLIQAREKELGALEVLLPRVQPELDLVSVKPRANYPKVSGLKWNKLTTTILSCLREAEGVPVRSDHILEYVIAASGRNIESREDRTIMRLCVKKRLNGLWHAGKIERHHAVVCNSLGYWSLSSSTARRKGSRASGDSPANTSQSRATVKPSDNAPAAL